MKLVLHGNVDTSGKTALDSGLFNACVMANGKCLAETQISANGEYLLELELDAMPETVELKVYPSTLSPEEAGRLGMSKVINSSQFVPKKGSKTAFSLNDRIFLPTSLLEYIKVRARKYHVHGTVYVEHPSYFSTLPGCRIDFYEVDTMADGLSALPGLETPGKTLPPFVYRRDFLGSAYTRVDGTYDFHFRFGVLPTKPWERITPGHPLLDKPEYSPFLPESVGKPLPRFDLRPDIRAKFYLYINGVWTLVHEAPMLDVDWNIGTDYHRDYRIPSASVAGVVDAGTKPATGFRFKTIGFLPVDATRIVDGYAFSKAGDPCSPVTREPFCDTLRIHGLFAAAPAVASYTVEILRTNSSGAAIAGEVWKAIGAPLTNLEWNDTTRVWESRNLALPGGRYRNIDIEPPMNWLEPSLKVIWNTNNNVNGYYKLRISGFDAANAAAGVYELPMIRIDNGLPEAALDVIAPAATVCGNLTLGGDRQITFRVTAYEADGHLYQYHIYGSRGRYAESAGATVVVERPDVLAPWTGIVDDPVQFNVVDRSPATSMCSMLAYSFRLRVQASGTNGVYNELVSRRRWAETNLIIAE